MKSIAEKSRNKTGKYEMTIMSSSQQKASPAFLYQQSFKRGCPLSLLKT